MTMSRREFVRETVSAAVTASVTGPGLDFNMQAVPHDEFFETLVGSNDSTLPATLTRLSSSASSLNVRGLVADMGSLIAAYCAHGSSHYQDIGLVTPIEQAAERLLTLQHADGTIDSGNYNSPPDTGFVVQSLCDVLTVLRNEKKPQLTRSEQPLIKFLFAAADALTTGGVHTPNHRWVISSALAQVNALYPQPKYIARVNDWLGEGIYCDQDGQFSERSTGVYSAVVTSALIRLARLLGREELLDPVRRNLRMNVFYMHPDGELETIASRRQDEMGTASIDHYCQQYRFMAIHDQDFQFAAVARFIEENRLQHLDVRSTLVQFMSEPLYRRALPKPDTLPTSYARFFSNSSVARIRRGDRSATIYGGCDFPIRVASGLATNPTFFNFRKGGAVLESVRLIPDFFNEGCFRSRGLRVDGDRYLLAQTLSVPYYQPLPKHLRNAAGDYALTPADDRFYSKMNFPERAKSNVQSLDQRIEIQERDGAFELTVTIDKHDRVPVTIEFIFRNGGTLSGTEASTTLPNTHFLRQGTGAYRVGGDTISFGPGQTEHEAIPTAKPYLDPWIGSAFPDRTRVYITGFSPFRKTLTIA